MVPFIPIFKSEAQSLIFKIVQIMQNCDTGYLGWQNVTMYTKLKFWI